MNVSEAELSSNEFMPVIPIFFHHKTNKKRNNQFRHIIRVYVTKVRSCLENHEMKQIIHFPKNADFPPDM